MRYNCNNNEINQLIGSQAVSENEIQSDKVGCLTGCEIAHFALGSCDAAIS